MSEGLNTGTVVLAEIFCFIPMFIILYSLSRVSDPVLSLLGFLSGVVLILSIFLMVFEIREPSW